jgi:hypothetical protein
MRWETSAGIAVSLLAWRGRRSIDGVIKPGEWLPASAEKGQTEHGSVAAMERSDPG